MTEYSTNLMVLLNDFIFALILSGSLGGIGEARAGVLARHGGALRAEWDAAVGEHGKRRCVNCS